MKQTLPISLLFDGFPLFSNRPKKQDLKEQLLKSLKEDRQKRAILRLEQAPKWLKKDSEVVRAIVEKLGLKFCNDTIRSDRDLVLLAVSNNYDDLKYADKKLYRDDEIIMAGIKRSGGFALKYAHETLKFDHGFVLEAMAETHKAFEYAPEHVRDTFKVAMPAVMAEPANLFYAGPKMRDNADVVMAAVSIKGGAIEFASQRLKADRDVVLKAMQTGSDDTSMPESEMLRYVSRDLRADYDVVLAAVKTHGCNIKFAAKALRRNPKIAFAAVSNCAEVFETLPLELRAHKKVLAALAKQNTPMK